MYRILVVDDEKIVRLALKTIIGNHEDRFQITGEASDGLMALELIKKQSIDIVITDLKMPKMDGIQLIKTLKKDGFTGRILVLSNYDDYDLVREAMKHGATDYLLKLVIEDEEFMSALEEVAKDMDQNPGQSSFSNQVSSHRITALQDLVLNTYKKDYFHYLSTYDLAIDPDANMIFMLSIDHIRSKELKERIRDHTLFQNSVMNIISNSLGPTYKGEVIGLEYRHFFVLLPITKPSIQSTYVLEDIAKQMVKDIHMYMNVSSTVVIKDTSIAYTDIHQTAKDLREVMEYKFYKEHEPFIHMDAINLNKTEFSIDLATLIAEQKETLRSFEIDKLCLNMTTFLEGAVHLEMPPQQVKIIVNTILESFMGLLIEAGDMDVVTLEEAKRKLYTLEFIREYSEEVLLLINKIYNRYSQLQGSKYRQDVSNSIAYIQKHLHEKIHVKDVAMSVNLTENYLARIFKQDTGQTLIQFINEVKMKKAMELLKNKPELMIRQVAETLGIQDQFYFVRLFKKHTGMTPSQYKRSDTA